MSGRLLTHEEKRKQIGDDFSLGLCEKSDWIFTEWCGGNLIAFFHEKSSFILDCLYNLIGCFPVVYSKVGRPLLKEGRYVYVLS